MTELFPKHKCVICDKPIRLYGTHGAINYKENGVLKTNIGRSTTNFGWGHAEYEGRQEHPANSWDLDALNDHKAVPPEWATEEGEVQRQEDKFHMGQLSDEMSQEGNKKSLANRGNEIIGQQFKDIVGNIRFDEDK